MYLSGGSVGPGAWLLELSPELLVFWVGACCPSCPLWGALPWAWALMLPNGGKEFGFEEGIPLPGWPADVIRLPEDVEPLTGPLALLLGTEEPPVFPGPCWLEVELGVCVDDDWFGEGKGWAKSELSNGCDARYGAEKRARRIFLFINMKHWKESSFIHFQLDLLLQWFHASIQWDEVLQLALFRQNQVVSKVEMEHSLSQVLSNRKVRRW